MRNITLSLDETTLKKARRIALERDTSLTGMIREYLERLAQSEDAQSGQRAQDLRASFANLSRPMGERDWKRDDLYE